MKMTTARWVLSIATGFGLLVLTSVGHAQGLKMGYIDSRKILATYKEALDAQKKLDDLNAQWEREARTMQQELKDLEDQLEKQSLLLSDEKKQEKLQEIQNKYIKFQQFQQEKWGQPSGEFFKRQQELMGPVIDKINTVIDKIGEAEKFDYIFDTINANIVYVNPKQPDLTDRVLEELNKGVTTSTKTTPGSK